MDTSKIYILALDVGTTSVRSYIYNSKAEILGKNYDKIILYHPSPGFVEIDPEEIWTSVKSVVTNAILDANLTIEQITAMGISTQRSTFLTWSRQTGEPFHKLIAWKDLRANQTVKEWNQSKLMKFVKGATYTMFLLTKMRKLKIISIFKFMNTQTFLRLYWMLKNNELLKKAIEEHDVMFGTLDCWLLHKLTARKLHISDVSSVCVTGFFDPFTMIWSKLGLYLLKLPASALPKIVDTAGDHFTCTDKSIWGHEIPILSSMGDQIASMWGSCCFNKGDTKLTLGTGTFLDINSGDEPHGSIKGLYPVVGWRIGTELYYVAEGATNDTAAIILQAQQLGLFDDPNETEHIAYSVPDSDGVYFILERPMTEESHPTGFIDTKPTTTRAHLVRALLESLTFSVVKLYKNVCNEILSRDFYTLRLDGGVSNNSFIAQLIADLTGVRVERPAQVEMSALGCAHIVGMQLGIWKSKEELQSLRPIGEVFHPRSYIRKSYEEIYNRWLNAVNEYDKTHRAA